MLCAANCRFESRLTDAATRAAGNNGQKMVFLLALDFVLKTLLGRQIRQNIKTSGMTTKHVNYAPFQMPTVRLDPETGTC